MLTRKPAHKCLQQFHLPKLEATHMSFIYRMNSQTVLTLKENYLRIKWLTELKKKWGMVSTTTYKFQIYWLKQVGLKSLHAI